MHPPCYRCNRPLRAAREVFPLRHIRLIIGAPPCGETDTLARVVGANNIAA